MNKLEIQVDNLQKDFLKLRKRVYALERTDNVMARTIRLELEELRDKRKILLKAGEDTKFNAGQIQICQKILGLFDSRDTPEPETTDSAES